MTDFRLVLLAGILSIEIHAADPMPTWSAEQQAVIEVQQECWEAWYEGYDEWLEACQPIDELVWWFPKSPVESLDDQKRDGRKWREGLELNRFHHLRAQAVQIFGDTAVIYYDVVYWDRQWGTELHVQERRVEVLRKIDDRWRIAGGMVAEVD